MTAQQLSERHHRDHPMRHLTDDELWALDELSKHTAIFSGSIHAALDDLGVLAMREDGDRQLARDLNKGGGS